MSSRVPPSPDGRASSFRPADLAPRLRWTLRLAAAIRWGTVAAVVGMLVAVLAILGTDACSGDDTSFGLLPTLGALVLYGGALVATACGAVLPFVGRLQPDWRRRTLLLVPVTWLAVVGTWAAAFGSCGIID